MFVVCIGGMDLYQIDKNRASDGTYLVAIMGMRSPALDVAMRMPNFRRRMARRIAPDQCTINGCTRT